MQGKIDALEAEIDSALSDFFKDKGSMQEFAWELRADCLEEYLKSVHRERKTLYEAYLPPRRHADAAKYLGSVSKEAMDWAIWESISMIYQGYHIAVRESENGVAAWLSGDGMDETRELLEKSLSLMGARFDYRLRNWHKNVKKLRPSQSELDELVSKSKAHYLRAAKAAACLHAVSQRPREMDKAEFGFKNKFSFSDKSVRNDMKISGDAPFVSSCAYLNPYILELAKVAKPNDATKSLLECSCTEYRRAYMEGKRMLPLEKLTIEAFPFADLNPYRIRDKGGVFSKYLELFLVGSSGEAPERGLMAEALPEIPPLVEKRRLPLFSDSVIYLGLYPLLIQAARNNALEDVKRLGVKGVNMPYNGVTANIARDRGKCAYLNKKYVLGKKEKVVLYRLKADEESAAVLNGAFGESGRIMPETYSGNGIGIERVECTPGEAEELCLKSQCLSMAHMKTLCSIPLRDVLMQGIHTSFSANELEEAFCWNEKAMLSKSVAGPLWDVAFHFGSEGALVFPYAHRSGYAGCRPSAYSAAHEELQKGAPIVNVRKPDWADMSTGKYKKSTRPKYAPEGKFLANLPYFTLDSLAPEFKRMSIRLLACDYAKAYDLDRKRIPELTEMLCAVDPAGETCGLDDIGRPVFLIEGEKKALALKALNDANYVSALDAYLREAKAPVGAYNFHASVGVGGVWFAKTQSNDLFDDLKNSVPFGDRVVGVMFDKDAAEKAEVVKAFLRGACSLKKAGAQKVLCPLMAGPNQADPDAKGLDDEIASILNEDWSDLTYAGHAARQMDAYKSYAPFFARIQLPARCDIKFSGEKKFLKLVSACERKTGAECNFDPELGMMYAPEEMRHVRMRAMTEKGSFDGFMRSEIKISERGDPCAISI